MLGVFAAPAVCVMPASAPDFDDPNNGATRWGQIPVRVSQFSDPRKKGTLFGAWTIFSGAKKRGKIIGATEQLRF